jgi:hypothetical protein
MSGRLIAPFGVVLLLMGCAVPSSPGQVGYSGTTPLVVNDPGPDYRYVMTEIGGRYAADLSWHDPQHVTDDVEKCYKIEANGSIQGIFGEQSTRRCPALDYVAYKDNQIATHNYQTPGNPYFSEAAAAQRWTFYGPRAGFKDAESMFQYMRGTYAFVKPTQVYVTNARKPPPLVPPPGTRLPSVIVP